MKTMPLRYLVATGALLSAALMVAGVLAGPVSAPPALQVWRSGALPTEIVAGPRIAGADARLVFLKASNAETADAFGSSVAMSRDGNTLVVGADLEDGDARGNGVQAEGDRLPGAGAVYVFTRSGARWVEQAYLKAPVPEAGAGFGLAVSVSHDGRTVVVGAPFETHAQGEGAVHVFQRDRDSWQVTGSLRPAAGTTTRLFGARLAMAGDGASLAVGAREGDPNQAQGIVHVYTVQDHHWVSLHRLEAAQPAAGDGFGQSLAFSADGRILAVGSRPEPSAALRDTAPTVPVHVFIKEGPAWTRTVLPHAVEPALGPRVATEVALSADGRRLVVGASEPTSGGAEVRVFDHQPQGWREVTKVHSAGQAWGFAERLALSADGRRLVVSAMYEPSPVPTGTGMPEAGAVYVFEERDTGAWQQAERFHVARSRGGDLFGSALAISGNGRLLATGARLEDRGAPQGDAPLPARPAINSGAVFVYEPA